MALDTVEVSHLVKSPLEALHTTKFHVFSLNPPFEDFLLNHIQRQGQTSSPGVSKPHNLGMRSEAHGQ